ncbi:MAG: hypothetical protein ACT4PZ_11305 [Panacagrimonas sp.]
MAKSKTRKRAVSAASKQRPGAKRKAPVDTGPLTLVEARKIAGVLVEPTKPPANRRLAGSPRRMLRAVAAVPAVEITPVALAAQRQKLDLMEKKQRKQRVRDYKATLLLLQKRGVKDLAYEAPADERRRAPGAAGGSPEKNPLRVLAEGDSWFDYPVPFFGGGLIPRLEKRLGVPILNLAKAGDETRFMLGVEQRQLIERHLKEGAPDGSPWELMLFSGGGNDVVAQPLALWLRDFSAGTPPAKLINQPRFTSALALVLAAYEDLIEIRDRYSKQTHLVFHAYDFAIPDGRGICHIGPWLKPAFDLRRFPGDRIVSTAVVQEMLEQFAKMLRALTKPNVTFIDAQRTLKPVPASWHNEMHPGKAGFNQIANKFHMEIKKLFPERVL